MKAVNVDDVLKILYKYGKFIFMTDEKRYSSMVDEIANLKALKQEPKTGRWIDDKCSVCGKGTEDLISSPEWYRNEEPNFCPFCGVKLESEDKE